MIEGLKPYPEYKESGLAWVPRIPTTWDTARNGNLFQQRNETRRSDLPVLEVSLRTGVRIRNFEASKRKQVMADFGKYKRAAAGDIAYNMMRMWQGAVGVAPVDGLVSPAYVVARPFLNTKPSYYASLFRMGLYLGEIDAVSRGIVKDRNRLYWDQFKQMRSLVPPPDEQAAIVRFLDHANRKIDGFIRAKKRELSLITEMLLTVAEESLVKPDAEIMRLSSAAALVHRPIDRRPREAYTRIGLYNRGRGIFQKPTVCGAELGDSDFFWIQEGDLVISGQFAWEGAVALAREKDEGCIASHRYPILRGRANLISSAALLAILRTKLGGVLMDHHSRGAAGRNRPLNIKSLLNEKFPIPSLPSQIRIENLLEQENRMAKTIARGIRLVDEYRTRLTADIVTGKLDVREAAAKLPDPVAEEAGDSGIPGEETELEEVEG